MGYLLCQTIGIAEALGAIRSSVRLRPHFVFTPDTVETRIKNLDFSWGSLDGFLSNGLVFSSPHCKVHKKVSVQQSFLNIGHCKK